MHTPGRHHPAHLMILTLPDSDPALPCPHGLQNSRKADRAVPQGESFCKSIHILCIGSSLMAGIIDLRHFLFGTDQPVKQVAVIGKQQQTFRLLIQPSYRLQILIAQICRQLIFLIDQLNHLKIMVQK